MGNVVCPACNGKAGRLRVVLAADRRSQRDDWQVCRKCKGSGEVPRKTVSVKLPADSLELLLNCIDEMEYLHCFGDQTQVFSDIKQAVCERLGVVRPQILPDYDAT